VKKKQLKKNLSRLRSAQLVERARHHEQRMDGNAAFPDPNPTKAEIAAAREALEAAMAEAMEGGRTAMATKRARHRELLDLLSRLGDHVSSVADGNELAILSMGFEVRRTPQPAPEPAAPVGLLAGMEAHAGQALLRWTPERHALTYMVQVNRVSPDDATAWESMTVVSSARYRAKGLASAKVHWFRVAAIGTKGMGPWSDVAHTLIR
jgi:hypothetical protein